MRWASAKSERETLDVAIAEAAAAVRAELGAAPHLTCVFPTQHYARELSRLPDLLHLHIADTTLIGCSAGAVIGGGEEIEQRPAVAIIAALLPEVTVRSFHTEQDRLPDPDAGPGAWHAALGVPPAAGIGFILLADPFTIRTDQLLAGMGYAYPRSTTIGGVVSGAPRPGKSALFLEGRALKTGAVGVALAGDIIVDTVVAQGCRPIGGPLRVTACRHNLLFELDHRPPIEALRRLFESLDDEDQELARTALHLGVLTDELRPEARPGGFLIRNIIGIDPRHGVLAIGDELREGQTVQFHLRDAAASAHALDELLQRYRTQHRRQRASGALLFSCVGRGSQLYGRAGHDSELFQKHLGPIPIGGFFANGEIGPVGDASYLHGFTSAFAIFRPR